ncbi:uncharacterized protein LOC141602553 [Silene latifolia]|uniref:uncharacterized protein LOC141602553 n=1 Tax=Silene latifolia TaxID=37657 RepID=UPI003D76C9A8
MNTGSKLMGGQPFETYFKLKGKSVATGMQRLNSESQMINLLKSRDKDNKLDIYFIGARKGSVTKTLKTKNPIFPLDSVTDPSVQMMAIPISLRRSPLFASSPNPLRRSPRLATSPILEPVRRLDKLPTRRKLSEIYERENEGSNSDVVLLSDKQKGKQVVSEFENEIIDEEFDEDFDGGNGFDDGYWT